MLLPRPFQWNIFKLDCFLFCGSAPCRWHHGIPFRVWACREGGGASGVAGGEHGAGSCSWEPVWPVLHRRCVPDPEEHEQPQRCLAVRPALLAGYCSISRTDTTATNTAGEHVVVTVEINANGKWCSTVTRDTAVLGGGCSWPAVLLSDWPTVSQVQRVLRMRAEQRLFSLFRWTTSCRGRRSSTAKYRATSLVPSPGTSNLVSHTW